MQTRVLNGLAETARLARELAGRVAPGTCLALEGEMGSGKTTLVRELVGALGGDPREVSSPTFVLLNIYQTPRGRVFHLDAYRTQGAEDLEGIGFGELLDEQGVVVVEWASRVESIMPERTIWITLRSLGRTKREVSWGRRE